MCLLRVMTFTPIETFLPTLSIKKKPSLRDNFFQFSWLEYATKIRLRKRDAFFFLVRIDIVETGHDPCTYFLENNYFAWSHQIREYSSDTKYKILPFVCNFSMMNSKKLCQTSSKKTWWKFQLPVRMLIPLLECWKFKKEFFRGMFKTF